MIKKKRINYTKKDITKNLSIKIGLSKSYSSSIINSIIEILKDLISIETVNVKNFGTFKVLAKKERLGRNPRDNTTYKISARKTLSFIASRKLNENLNK
ncbi:HU family DNA-binding protein [Candidatus Pelagibacter bacterium]|nr:HU family DNA-binding protein [Candidatus Pelagibacter bacterium]